MPSNKRLRIKQRIIIIQRDYLSFHKKGPSRNKEAENRLTLILEEKESKHVSWVIDLLKILRGSVFIISEWWFKNKIQYNLHRQA